MGKKKNQKRNRQSSSHSILSTEEIAKKTREIEEALQQQRLKYQNTVVTTPSSSLGPSLSPTSQEQEQKSQTPISIPGMIYDSLTGRYYQESHLRKHKLISTFSGQNEIQKSSSPSRSCSLSSVIFSLQQRQSHGIVPRHSFSSLISNSIQLREEIQLETSIDLIDLCYHPMHGLVLLTKTHIFIPKLSQERMVDCLPFYTYTRIKWASSETETFEMALIMISNDGNDSKIRRVLFDNPVLSLSRHHPYVVWDFSCPKAGCGELPWVIDWAQGNKEILIGSDLGLYRHDLETNHQQYLVPTHTTVMTFDVVDPHRLTAVVGVRNGSIFCCDPRESTQTSLKPRFNTHHRGINHVKKQKSHHSPSFAFPTSIDFLSLRSNRSTVIAKDISGNISSFDIRNLSKEVMKISQSHSIRRSKIDYSRYYVSPDESFLFTTDWIQSQNFLNSLNSPKHDNSSMVIQSWSLSSELTKLSTLPFHPRNGFRNQKMNILFSTLCSNNQQDWNEDIFPGLFFCHQTSYYSIVV